jgi:hypothetical protein
MFSWIVRMRRLQNLCNSFEGPQKTSIATTITLMPTIETSHQRIQLHIDSTCEVDAQVHRFLMRYLHMYLLNAKKIQTANGKGMQIVSRLWLTERKETHIWEIAEKSAQQNFEENKTMSASHNLGESCTQSDRPSDVTFITNSSDKLPWLHTTDFISSPAVRGKEKRSKLRGTCIRTNATAKLRQKPTAIDKCISAWYPL